MLLCVSRPFSVWHPKFVIIDDNEVFLPSCNVSWEVSLQLGRSERCPVYDDSCQRGRAWIRPKGKALRRDLTLSEDGPHSMY